MEMVLTGAGGAIGSRVVGRLAENHDIVALDRDAAALKQLPDSVETHTVDLADEHAVQTTLAGKQVEAIVSAVGGYTIGALEDCSPAAFTRHLETNLAAVHTPVHTVLPQIRAAGGRIIVVGSVVGSVALPYHGAYSAAKAGLAGYVDTLRRELTPHGVDVAMIEPGPVPTGFNERAVATLADQPASAYAAAYAAFASYRPASTDVETVVDYVYEAVDADRPKARYRVGGRARWLPRLQSVLPARVFDRLVRSGLPGGILYRLIDR